MRKTNFQHLKSPVGVLKIIHVIFGGVSIALIFMSYVPALKMKLFLVTVAICLGISSLYLVAHVIWNDFLMQSKINRIFNLVFHILGAMALIVCGIDLSGWSESEYDITCTEECPNIYFVGVSKILTFINGTLYGIAGVLETKKDEDEYSEVLPLKFVPATHNRYDGHSNPSVICVNST